jgi:hypothetical protein
MERKNSILQKRRQSGDPSNPMTAAWRIADPSTGCDNRRGDLQAMVWGLAPSGTVWGGFEWSLCVFEVAGGGLAGVLVAVSGPLALEMILGRAASERTLNQCQTAWRGQRRISLRFEREPVLGRL